MNNEWIQDAMYYMMMAKLNEADAIRRGEKVENGLFRIMRSNEINFDLMHELGIEPHDVPNFLIKPFITPRK